MIKKIITHDRVHHADEVMATAMLLSIYPDAEVVRTRDVSVLAKGAEDPCTALLDVGGIYNPMNHQYDHHQPKGAGLRNNDAMWPYATAGLVWLHFGEEVVKVLQPAVSELGRQEIVRYIDDSIIRFIDAADCGIKIRSAGPSLSTIIAGFNSAWHEEGGGDFALVVELAKVIIANQIKRFAGKVLARDKVRAAKTILNDQVLILDRCIPWADVVAEERPSIRLVAYPVSHVDSAVTGQWQIRVACNMDKSVRMSLPTSWAGLEHKALEEVSGTRGSIFCHRNRHLAGATGMRGAIEMAQKAMAHAA